METVTLSEKYQVVIPKRVREAIGLLPGARLEVIEYGDRIELIPVGPVRRLRGFLPGLDTGIEREGDRP